MRSRSLILAAVAAAGLAPAAAMADAPVDVTRTAVIQRDLAVAEAYWQRPAPCAALTVTVRDLAPATGNGGVLVAHPAGETPLGGCEISLSPQLWHIMFSPPVAEFAWSTWTPDGVRMLYGQMHRAYGCGAIEHEYGHTLGLLDVAGSGLMDDTSWPLTPECVRAYAAPARPWHRRR